MILLFAVGGKPYGWLGSHFLLCEGIAKFKCARMLQNVLTMQQGAMHPAGVASLMTVLQASCLSSVLLWTPLEGISGSAVNSTGPLTCYKMTREAAIEEATFELRGGKAHSGWRPFPLSLGEGTFLKVCSGEQDCRQVSQPEGINILQPSRKSLIKRDSA